MLEISKSFPEKIETSKDASALLQKQEGSYLDVTGIYSLTYDKRNQKYEPSDGFISTFSQNIPLAFNESQTIVNGYEITNYNMLDFAFYTSNATVVCD